MGNNDSTVEIIIFLLCFWGMLAFISSYFNVEITNSNLADLTSNTQDTTKEENIIDKVLDFLDDVPVIKVFTPLIKIMTFQYKTINPYISIIIDVLIVLSILSVYLLIKK